jgi:hypothetical protein
MFKLEYSAQGSLRIIAPDGTATAWTGYEFFPSLEWDGRTYVAFGPYYEGSLPTSKVFCLTEVASLAVSVG